MWPLAISGAQILSAGSRLGETGGSTPTSAGRRGGSGASLGLAAASARWPSARQTVTTRAIVQQQLEILATARRRAVCFCLDRLIQINTIGVARVAGQCRVFEGCDQYSVTGASKPLMLCERPAASLRCHHRRPSDLSRTLRLQAPGGVEDGFRRRPRRPSQHAPRLIRRNHAALSEVKQPSAHDGIEERKQANENVRYG
jgi:hypothetical protein